MAWGVFAATGCAALSFVSPARADALSELSANISSVSDLVFQDIQHITIGLGPKFGPDYKGSDDYKVKPDLTFNLRFGNRFSASTEGVEFTLFGIRRVTFGPTVHISGRRGAHVNPDIEGLGRLRRSPELGVFAKALWPDQLSLRLSVRQGIARGHEGTLVELEGSAQVYRNASEDVTGYLGFSTTWTDSHYTQSFFGIDAGQAAASGLPEYHPGNSMRDASVSATLRWVLSPHWALNSVAEYSRLIDDVASSPMVEDVGSPNQFSIGVVMARTFRLK